MSRTPDSALTPRLPAAPGVDIPRRRRLAVAVLVACRPKQWIKNLLVFAAPVAGGSIGHSGILGRTLMAFAAFCIISSGGYLINDRRDYRRDRQHPVKRHRPVAAGEVGLGLATTLGVVLLAGGVMLAAFVSLAFLAAAAAYIALTLVYSVWLREVVVLDVVTIASLFIIRAIAGGAATHTPLSRWFLVVTSFSALFVVCGKRLGEFAQHDHDQEAVARSRKTLDNYSTSYLRGVCLIAATVAIAAYCQWAFERPYHGRVPWPELSIIPFLVGLMRYWMLIDAGVAASPEDAVLNDSFTRLTALAWIAVFVLGSYAPH